MLEEYYKYKISYREYIVMIKIGNFYEIFDKDAVILSNVFNYKLSKISDTIKCGFPISSLEKVLNVLKSKQINYVVIEKNNITNKESFDNNIYNSFDFDINNIKYNFLRINKITKYLNDNAYNNINELLEGIEELINERR
jgi:hypothetical protein